MREEEVKIQSGEVVLIGTLCVPENSGKFPAVLMVHGSGPLDRNENMKGRQLNIFNTFAHALADCGIASLRYDKRGCGSSSGDFMSAGHFDLVQDAVHCLDTLACSDYVSDDNLYVLAHSEGCLIAPQISQRRPSVSGLILVCPFIERVESVLVRQAAQIEKEIDSLPGISGLLNRAAFKIFGKPSSAQQRLLEKVRKTDSPVVRSGVTRRPAKWLREMLELDTEAIFANTHTPMLLITGKKDLQCNPQDIFRIAELAPGQSETLMVDDMTHLLRADEKPATLLGSARLSGEAVERTVIDRSIEWIAAMSAADNQLHATGKAGA